MTPTAVFLLIVSAILHVAWNVGGKVSGPSPQFFRRVALYTAVLLTPVMIYCFPAFSAVHGSIWLYILVSGFFQAIYFSGLSGAYLSGHLSVAYPLARTWPALFVVVVSILRGHGDSITTMVVLGIVLILAGSTVLPLGRLRELRVSTYANASCAYALLAAVGTTGYTVVDDAGLRHLADAGGHPRWLMACTWLGYEGLATAIWLGVFQRFHIVRDRVGDSPKTSRWKVVFVATGMGSAYALVLICYTMVDDVSYVAAFRQMSVPLGAIAGVVLLREPGPSLKFVGVTFMFVGLVLVALG